MNGKTHKKIRKIYKDQIRVVEIIRLMYFGRKALYMSNEETYNFVKKVYMKDRTIDFLDTQETLGKIRKAIGKETPQS